VNLSGLGWAGFKKMDPRPTLCQYRMLQSRMSADVR